jgi:hypothetical protein
MPFEAMKKNRETRPIPRPFLLHASQKQAPEDWLFRNTTEWGILRMGNFNREETKGTKKSYANYTDESEF